MSSPAESATDATSPFYGLARSLLFALPPEAAHELVVSTLERGLYVRDTSAIDLRLGQTIAGLAFPNPVGIAAGFDKDARVPDAVIGLGCGFAEIGTVTPLAQSGNPQPRVFRLVAERAMINRLGFNNAGHEAACARLQRRLERRLGDAVGGAVASNRPGAVASNNPGAVASNNPGAVASNRPGAGNKDNRIIGVNIGANKDSADRIGDYVAGIETFYDLAAYFMVNVSSPNTTGLRKLQDPSNLDELLARVMAARHTRVDRGEVSKPVFVKIAPDIGEDEIAPICAQLAAHGVDGIAVSNTTLSRTGVQGRVSREGGGLSGAPLFERSTVMLARVYRETAGRIPLIGIGGIDSGATALAKIEAGASLIQIYTGLVYEGPGLIGRIKRHLADAVAQSGETSIEALRGRRAAEWAAKPLG